jgi:RNA ligase (TIGR02306 family)
MNIERKLATIRKITDINPIPDADAIELASVDGWNVVVKKDEFKIGDSCIYIEIDSWVPTEIAPFLSKGKPPREYQGIKGERLKSIMLRKQLSQGLILNYWDYPNVVEAFHKTRLVSQYDGDFDVTEILGIVKWEKEISANLQGIVKGNFPSFIPKTDQIRSQNMGRTFSRIKDENYTWELTEKLDGSSLTMYINKDGVFGVCSRNYDLERDENNAYWKAAAFNGIDYEAILRNYERMDMHFALQGELVGEGVQGNPYNIKGTHFYIFDIFDIDEQKYLSAINRKLIIDYNLKLSSVPVIHLNYYITDYNSRDILELADGHSRINDKVLREGLVFKCAENPDISFKAISNKWLLKNGDK